MDLYKEFKVFEKGMIGFLIPEWIKNNIFSNRKKGMFFTSLLLFLSFIIVLKAITLIAYDDKLTGFNDWVSVVYVAMIATYCIVFVHRSYSYSITQLKILENPTIIFRKNILSKWISIFKKPINQVLFSIFCTVIFWLFLYWSANKGLIAFPIHSKTSFLILFAFFWLSQGSYWAILLPLLTLLFKQIDFDNDSNFSDKRDFFSENIPMLKALSKVFKYISAVMAFTVVLCLIGISLMPFNYFNINLIISLVVLGYLITFWTLIFSHINIAKTEKIVNNIEIQFWSKYITSKNYKLKEQDIHNNELIALNSAINIYNFIQSNKVKFFNYSLISRSFWSFVIPTMVAIVGTILAGKLQ